MTHEDFLASHAGHPLGVGAPTGKPLREDGESHMFAWVRVVRGDPCSYCGGPAGTVDHIVPQDPLVPNPAFGGKHDWLNLTASCPRCNSRKGCQSLLRFLHGPYRRGKLPPPTKENTVADPHGFDRGDPQRGGGERMAEKAA